MCRGRAVGSLPATVYLWEGQRASEELVALGHELAHAAGVGDEGAAERYGKAFAHAAHYGMALPGREAAGLAA